MKKVFLLLIMFTITAENCCHDIQKVHKPCALLGKQQLGTLVVQIEEMGRNTERRWKETQNERVICIT